MKLSFDQWRAQVNLIILRNYGLSLDDLPDVCLMDWYEDETTPRRAARRAIKSAQGEDDFE